MTKAVGTGVSMHFSNSSYIGLLELIYAWLGQTKDLPEYAFGFVNLSFIIGITIFSSFLCKIWGILTQKLNDNFLQFILAHQLCLFFIGF